jgi:hypothetical protein
MSLEHTRFLWNNLVDTATLAASSAATGLPVTNIAHEMYTKVWRATGCASEWVSFDLGAAPGNVTNLVIKGHNFSSAASIRIQADNHSNFGSLDIDIILYPVTSTLFYTWASNQAYRYWRITIADAGNTATYVEIGRVFLGTHFAPTYDVSSWSFENIDPSGRLTSTGGQLTANLRSKYKTRTYQYACVPASDKDIWETIFDTVGQVKPIFIVENTYDAGSVKYATFTGSLNFDFLLYDTTAAGFLYDLSFTLEEAR